MHHVGSLNLNTHIKELHCLLNEFKAFETRKLWALEMDFCRKSCGISKLDHIRNEEIRADMNIGNNIIDTIS